MTQFELKSTSFFDDLPDGQTAPIFVDINGDGLQEAIIGVGGGTLRFYENTGTKTAAILTEKTGTDNPFDGISVVDDQGDGGFGVSHPALADIDKDGDLDLFIGNAFGDIYFYENTGNATTPTFSSTATRSTKAGNLFNISAVGQYATPTFTDIDGDGDLDLFIGQYDSIVYYQNDSPSTITNLSDIVFTAKTGSDNPLNVVVSSFTNPTDKRFDQAFLDIDSDGDLDAFIGQGDGQILYYENQGTKSSPSFIDKTETNNPFDTYNKSASLQQLPTPTFVDIDGDEQSEAFIGSRLKKNDNDGGGIAEFKQIDPDPDPIPHPIPDPKTAKQYRIVNDNQNPLVIKNEKLLAPVLFKFNEENKLDILIGTDNKKLIYRENKGNGTFGEPSANPFDSIDLADTQGALKPALVDIDGDGDIDLFVGDDSGSIHFFDNKRIDLIDTFVKESKLFGLESVEKGAAPTFIVDGGKVKWAFIGAESDKVGIENYLKIFKFDEAEKKFVEIGKNEDNYPFKNAQLQIDGKKTKIVPAFGDYDKDKDLDAIIGQTDVDGKEGQLLYFENIGTSSDPNFVQRKDVGNPFKNVNGIQADRADFNTISPTVGNFVGDGKLEVFAGTQTEDGINGMRYLVLPGEQQETTKSNTFDPDKLILEGGTIFKMGKVKNGGRVKFKLANINIEKISEITISFLDSSNKVSFSEVLFSTLPPGFQPRGFAFGRQKLFLNVQPNQRFKINIQSLDRTIVSQEASIIELNSGQFRLNFASGLTIEIEQSLENPPIGVGNLQKSGLEILDLEGLSGLQSATFTLTREARYTNEVYFYRISDTNGTIDGLAPGQEGYAEAAIRNRVDNIALQVGNQSENTENGSFNGGFLYAPIIIANGSAENFLNQNPDNLAGQDIQAYFVFGEANSDRADHIRLLGSNTFGFEDLPDGGDLDYNDIIVEVNFA